MRILTALLVTVLLGLLDAGFSHGDGQIPAREHTIKRRRPPSIGVLEQVPQALPEPTGPYRIGTAIFHLADTSRPDSLSKKPGQFRELMFQLWYPTDLAPKGET